MDKKFFRYLISYAPGYAVSVMFFITRPFAFIQSRLGRDDSVKESVTFLVISFVVLNASVLYGIYSSYDQMLSTLRWDAMIRMCLVITILATIQYTVLRVLNRDFSHEECLTCVDYYIGGVFVLVSMFFTVCRPLSNALNVSFLTSNYLNTGHLQLNLMDGATWFMILVLVTLLGLLPLWMMWGIGRAARLGVVANSAFMLIMSSVVLMTALIFLYVTSPPSSPANGAFPVGTAYNAYMQASHQTTLFYGDTVLQDNYSPNSGTIIFNGQAVHSVVETVTMKRAGSTVMAIGPIIEYAQFSPFRVVGLNLGSPPPYTVVRSSSPIPATASVGQAGPIYSATDYHDSKMATVDAQVQARYFVSGNNSTSVLFCVNVATTGVTAHGTADGEVAYTISRCFIVDNSGNAALTSMTLSLGHVTDTFEISPRRRTL